MRNKGFPACGHRCAVRKKVLDSVHDIQINLITLINQIKSIDCEVLDAW